MSKDHVGCILDQVPEPFLVHPQRLFCLFTVRDIPCKKTAAFAVIIVEIITQNFDVKRIIGFIRHYCFKQDVPFLFYGSPDLLPRG